MLRKSVIIFALLACCPVVRGQSVFDMPRLFPKHVQAVQAFVQSIANGDLLSAEEAALEGVKQFPDDALWKYNVSCIKARQGRTKEALDWLKQAIESGFRNIEQLKTDGDLKLLREDESTRAAFEALVEEISAAKTHSEIRGALYEATPSTIPAGKSAEVTTTNTQWEWDIQRGGFMTTRLRLLPYEEVPTYTGPYADIVAPWHDAALKEKGERAHYNLLYVNRDEDACQPNFDGSPFITSVYYSDEAVKSNAHTGVANGIFSTGLHDIPVLGSSSTIYQRLPFWRSGPRLISTNAKMTALAYRFAFANQLYVYDATPDLSARFHGDILTAQQPFYFVTADLTPPPYKGALDAQSAQKEILELIAAAVEAMQPETRNAMFNTNRFVWTMQRLFREAQKEAKDIFDPKAHPVAFNIAQLDTQKLLERAHTLTPEALPPMFCIRMLREERPIQYVDFFDPTTTEAFADTSMSISRIVRGRNYTRTMTIEATGEPGLSFHWFVVNGDTEKIRIKPLTKESSITTIEVDWHGLYTSTSGTPIRRVDLACIAVRPDGITSAPAFVSLRYLANEKRTYKEGQLISIDYMPPASGFVYEDPAITTTKLWSDHFNYDAKGQLTGWVRYAPAKAPESFTAQGLRVKKGTAAETAPSPERVNYQPRLNPRSDGISSPALELLQF